MRRLYVASVLSGLLLFYGAAFSTAGPPAGDSAERATDESPIRVQRTTHALEIRDEAAMVLLGTILIGVAGAVRRAA